MKIIEFFECNNKEHWLNQINKSEWGAGKFLYQLLTENHLKELCGESTRVYLLTEGERLLSFCTFAPQDEVRDESLTPWIGFVFTFPEYRGHRYAGELLEHSYRKAKEEGYEFIYVSTNEAGLYEKYGYCFYQMRETFSKEVSRVYRIKIK